MRTVFVLTTIVLALALGIIAGVIGKPSADRAP